MVRVAGLKRRSDMGLVLTGSDGLSPGEVLASIADRTRELSVRHARCFSEDVRPALDEEGIRLVSWESLDRTMRADLGEYFLSKIFPVLTPLAVDPAHPFPYISGLSLNLAVLVKDPDNDIERFARIKVPNNVPRFVVVPKRGNESLFLPLEELIAAHLQTLFPGMDIVSPPSVPRHPQRRPRGRGGPRRGPAAGPGTGTGATPVRPGRAPRGGRGHRPRHPRPADQRDRDPARGRPPTHRACWIFPRYGRSTAGSTAPR